MAYTIKLLDVVALTENIPAENLYRGQVGTVVEVLADNVFEVEFIDHKSGQTYALATVRTAQLMLLHYEKVN